MRSQHSLFEGTRIKVPWFPAGLTFNQRSTDIGDDQSVQGRHHAKSDVLHELLMPCRQPVRHQAGCVEDVLQITAQVPNQAMARCSSA